MMISQIRLPFTLSDVYSGFAEANGLLYVQRDDVLVVEVQVKDAFLGVVKSKPKRTYIPFRDIVSLDFKKNWFITRLTIRVTSLEHLNNFPGDHQGEVKLNIKRRDREEAKQLASYVNLRISEIRLDMMDEGDL